MARFVFPMPLLLLLLLLTPSSAEPMDEESCLLQSKGTQRSTRKHNPADYNEVCAKGTSCICEDRGALQKESLSTCATRCVNHPGFTYVYSEDPVEGKSEVCACCTSLASISKVSMQSPSWAGTFMYV
mmetsp:Transcript_3302/g.7721  ORF Transcript_3302/g.7721 Transcript_3302/m.7721 type:complete len:128 (-) Transcript_3302:71-454(-)|eukprot:CAMPEP_0181445410 /NCGR_PEP_ID=MMETSP1110-20121109/25572_1 /TAXON_ID=174948 /ORGANISM="Symbiodinium sp., Strain CCMP421" /LENGTH=127 /DNA_ID=CAMNT_0023569451 /DNA_START=15 /DNA_END=398 /DNA_ORIENTATION=+